MLNVYLGQINYTFGNNAFLPYSVGRLWAYAESVNLDKHFRLAELLFRREPIADVVERMKANPPHVLGLSCYIWNWRYSMALLDAVKAEWPYCTIVIGGPQVPHGWHPKVLRNIDLIVHGEGEIAFAEILEAKLAELVASIPSPKAPPKRRIEDLSVLPSPYLSGVFDDLMALPYDWHALQETNRGCPYSCTFCDWGSAVFTKVRKFPDDILLAEIRWFADHEIDLLYNCDANYGILKRDVALATIMAETKRVHGFPNKFRAAYAKKATEGVFQAAKILSDADMSKGATVSLQSLNPEVLSNVKRGNIAVSDLPGVLKRYADDGVPTYSELILGLPGETYDTFADGVCTLLDAGQHDGINVYPCIMLPNSEMAEPAYVKEHGIETLTLPMLLLHGSPGDDPLSEEYDLVTATATMPHFDWFSAYQFAWAVQTFHCLGPLQPLARVLRWLKWCSYRTFYSELVQWMANNRKTIAGQLYYANRDMLQSVLARRGSWNDPLPSWGDVTWPPEEAALLKLLDRKETFYLEMWQFVRWLLGDDDPGRLIWDALEYSRVTLADPWAARQRTAALEHDIKGILDGTDVNGPLDNTVKIDFGQSYEGDRKAFARDQIWYGRKGSTGPTITVEASA